MNPRTTGWLALFMLGSTAAASAQQDPAQELEKLRKEIQALKDGQKAMQRQLQEISNLLRSNRVRPTAPREFVLDVEGKPFKGAEKARLTLVEFSDYQ